MLTGDLALFGLDQPLAAVGLRHISGAALADDLHPQLPCALGQRKGGTRRIDMAIVGCMQRGLDAVQIIEGMQFADSLGPDHLHRKAQPLADRGSLIKPVHLIVGIGQPQRTAAMPGDGLPGLFLKHP